MKGRMKMNEMNDVIINVDLPENDTTLCVDTQDSDILVNTENDIVVDLPCMETTVCAPAESTVIVANVDSIDKLADKCNTISTDELTKMEKSLRRAHSAVVKECKNRQSAVLENDDALIDKVPTSDLKNLVKSAGVSLTGKESSDEIKGMYKAISANESVQRTFAKLVALHNITTESIDEGNGNEDDDDLEILMEDIQTLTDADKAANKLVNAQSISGIQVQSKLETDFDDIILSLFVKLPQGIKDTCEFARCKVDLEARTIDWVDKPIELDASVFNDDYTDAEFALDAMIITEVRSAIEKIYAAFLQNKYLPAADQQQTVTERKHSKFLK